MDNNILEYDNFIIHYDMLSSNYSDTKFISDYLNDNVLRILDFFSLDHIDKVDIIIYSNYDDFKNNYYENYECQSWVCGYTKNNKIHILDLNTLNTCTTHTNDDINYIARTLAHEFVHIVQNTVERNNIGYKKNGYTYFREALACALGNYIGRDTCNMDISLDELTSGNKINYIYYYTLGKYMIDNIDHNKILEYVKDPSLLDNDIKEIYKNIKK